MPIPTEEASPVSSAESAPTGALPRRIGLWSAIAVCVGSTIGSGIFRSPAGVADKIPGPLPLLSVWAVGGVFAICGALTLAEVASAIPQTGGFYAFLREGWGRLYAFLFGWAQLSVVRAAALGAIAITFAEYFIRVLGFDPRIAPYDQYARYLAAAAIVLTGTMNILGVKFATALTNLTTIAKYGGLVFIVVIALFLGLPKTGGHFTPWIPPGSFVLSSAGLALVSALWAYDGWGDVSYVAGEVTEPQRNLPRALIGGTLAVIVIYSLANLAYLSVLSVDEIRVSKLVAADVAERVIGRPGVVIVSVTVMLSTFGTLSAVLLTSPRVLFAMADDGMLFKQVARVHPRFKTPYVAIALVGTLGFIFVLLRSFEQLADAFVIAMLPFYGGGVAAVYRLRARPGYVPKFKTPGYPIVPAVFLASVIFLLVNALSDAGSREATAKTLGIVVAGVPIWWIWLRKGRR